MSKDLQVTVHNISNKIRSSASGKYAVFDDQNYLFKTSLIFGFNKANAIAYFSAFYLEQRI